MSNRQIAVFWDLETCCPAPLEDKGKSTSTSTQGSGDNVDAGVVVNNIRRAIAAFGSLGSIKAYVGRSQREDATRGRSATGTCTGTTKFRLISSARRRLCLSGVQIVEPPLDDDFLSGSSKSMLISDILIHAMDCATKSPIVLITNDVEMSYPMALLRHRQYSVILVASSNSTGYEELKLQSSVFLDWDLDVLRRGPQLEHRSPSYQPASPGPQSISQESGSNSAHNPAKAPSVSSMLSRQTSNIPEVKRDDAGCSTCHPSPTQSAPLSPIDQPSSSRASTIPAVSSNAQPKKPISSVTSVGSGSSGTGWSISDLDGATDIELNLRSPPGWSHSSERKPDEVRSRRTPSPETPLVGKGAFTTGFAIVNPSWQAQTPRSSSDLGRMYPPSPSITDTADFITATSSSSQSTLGQRVTTANLTPAMNPQALPFTPAYLKSNTPLPAIPTPLPPIFRELTNADWQTPAIPKPSSPAFRMATIADWPTPSTKTTPLKNATIRPTSVPNPPSSSARNPTGKARKDTDLSAYEPMVARLDELAKKGKDEPGRSLVGEMKADKRALFAKAGVDNYTEYLESAERLGIIQLGGGKGNTCWVKLVPGWKEIILGIS